MTIDDHYKEIYHLREIKDVYKILGESMFYFNFIASYWNVIYSYFSITSPFTYFYIYSNYISGYTIIF